MTNVRAEFLQQTVASLRQFILSKLRGGASPEPSPANLSLNQDLLDDLCSEPTVSLFLIKEALELNHPISLEQWVLLAQYIQWGAQACRRKSVSSSSWLDILNAFRAAHDLARGVTPASLPPTIPHDFEDQVAKLDRRTGVGNSQDQFKLRFPASAPTPTNGKLAMTSEIQSAADREFESACATAAINLYPLLRYEPLFLSDESLNSALLPHRVGLWKLAARGHYARTDRPVRPKSVCNDLTYLSDPLPNFSQDGWSLIFQPAPCKEFRLGIQFPTLPGGPDVFVAIGSYPRIKDFRDLVLSELRNGRPTWDGPHFLGYALTVDGSELVWFRDNGYLIGTPLTDWLALECLVRTAWASPEIQARWNTLATEYGEI
ncbi:MAG: hypothetical protein ACREDR_10835 [Blastocatellia bacterium]